ncbi:BatD family protein [Zhongshania guokunii]|uniref:BatD family protein n=1 Tax=Zhongshania guokunii TaxID=641783 RepID=A0ABV3UAH8_9GAMM
MRLINPISLARTHYATASTTQPMKRHSAHRHFGALQLVLILFSILSGMPSAFADTSVRASVDRNQISSEETFILSLVADSILFTDEPDISALENDFHVIRRQQSSRTNIINGKVNSSRQWDYTLAPKREGNLTIPAITMGKYQTRALTISVSKASSQSRGSNGDSVYLESDVTPRSAYVQGELQYTVKIFTSVNFLDASLEAPEVDNAVIEATGEQRYQTLVDGRYYQVIERHYSIYPQTSGDLTIPALTLQARVEGYRPSMLDPGRLVVKRSQEHRLKIMPPPAEFKGAVWLPAKELVLNENWSKDPDNIRVGDSITRTVSIQADGLLGSQLPSLPIYTLSNAKLYPDQAKIEKGDEQSKWTGIRSESMAIIPTKAGEFILPEVRIPWWNTKTNKTEVAVLAERRITVRPALLGNGSNNTDATPNNLTAGGTSQAANTASNPNPNNDDATSTATSPLLWSLIALLCLSNAAFAAAWYRARHSTPNAANSTKAEGKTTSESQAFSQLKKCVQSAAAAPMLRSALIHWAQAHYQQSLSLSQLAQRASELKPYCDALDAQLFSQQGGEIDAKALIEAVKTLRGRTAKRSAETAPLAPLYPSKV